MVLDFWTENDGRVLTVEYARRGPLERVTADLSGERLVVTPSELRRGKAYSFEASGKVYVVNSIVSHGERYVSLYEDGSLVREYCYARERAQAIYELDPPRYDATVPFVRSALWIDAVIAGFVLSLTLILFGLGLDVFRSVWHVIVIALSLFVLYYAVAFGAHTLIHFVRRARMTRYGITRPLKNDESILPLRRKHRH